MDTLSASEILESLKKYVLEIVTNKKLYINGDLNSNNSTKSIFEYLYLPEYHDIIYQYVKANDVELSRLGLSTRPLNRLLANGYVYLSDI